MPCFSEDYFDNLRHNNSRLDSRELPASSRTVNLRHFPVDFFKVLLGRCCCRFLVFRVSHSSRNIIDKIV